MVSTTCTKQLFWYISHCITYHTQCFISSWKKNIQISHNKVSKTNLELQRTIIETYNLEAICQYTWFICNLSIFSKNSSSTFLTCLKSDWKWTNSYQLLQPGLYDPDIIMSVSLYPVTRNIFLLMRKWWTVF